MITKRLAELLGEKGYFELHHAWLKNRDGTPVRCRRNGRCKTWVREPGRWRLPVKYGLKQCFDITPSNCWEWLTDEQMGDDQVRHLHVAVLNRQCPEGVLVDKLLELGMIPEEVFS